MLRDLRCAEDAGANEGGLAARRQWAGKRGRESAKWASELGRGAHPGPEENGDEAVVAEGGIGVANLVGALLELSAEDLAYAGWPVRARVRGGRGKARWP